MIVAWRAPRDAVREALARERVPSALGPHHEGWTLARVLVDGDAVLEPQGRALVHLLADVARSLAAPGFACLRTGKGGQRIVVCAGTGRVVQADRCLRKKPSITSRGSSCWVRSATRIGPG